MKSIPFVLIIFFSLFFSPAIFAGGMGSLPPPCGGAGQPPCPIPLDNGVLALLIVGGIYGTKKIYDSLKRSQAKSTIK
jgi:hypothetical protein